MLLANISVARKIQEAFPQTAMLRRHASPPKTNFDILNDMLTKVKDPNFKIVLDSSKTLAESLDRIEDPNDLFQHISKNFVHQMYDGSRIFP